MFSAASELSPSVAGKQWKEGISNQIINWHRRMKARLTYLS
jgi:hypothetical protein